ncbi:MAG TPA: GNAT family N-acetyltransferase [Frankiaceae bacterium]|nr:GNAT family N-acetyltransferase [Frankiaceae bacterium]
MRIERHTDPVAYAALVRPYLLRDEPRFNLELAVLARVERGETYGGGAPLLLTVGDAPALMTPPFNVLVAAVPPDGAAGLAAYLHAEGVTFPGVLGSPETTGVLAEEYTRLSGRAHRVTREQGVYVLRALVPPRPAPGAPRVATSDDYDVTTAWAAAFAEEVGLPAGDLARMRDRVDEGMVWLWDDGGPVSLAGCGGFTPNGARVGPVYTPPGLRGRGYASAVTAGATEALLGRGLAYTFLYTDLANPTSNRIYRALGYEHVADVREVSFGG